MDDQLSLFNDPAAGTAPVEETRTAASGLVVAERRLVVHCKHDPYDIYIGRGSIWGNVYSSKPSRYEVQMVDTAEEAVSLYRAYVLKQPVLLARLASLHGKVLGCHCRGPKTPHAPCHGDPLVELSALAVAGQL